MGCYLTYFESPMVIVHGLVEKKGVELKRF